ncbi:MAG: enoyl-CoA hydratase/isomerase family protein [Pseudomonadota bacterium]
MSEIIAEKRGRLGLITLDRPKALNSLNLQMCKDIAIALDVFAADKDIAHVAMRSGENGRFFCAGGDIRTLQAQLSEKVYDEAENFFATEYKLNRKIARYPKPYISLIDGIVMGGGVGISGHGALRAVTENTVFAMPEVAIGFFPDVGVSRLLARLPGKTGAYLAVTGERIKAADMLYLGLATHHVPATSFDAIITMLADSDDAKAVLQRFHVDAGEAPIKNLMEKISHYFDGDTVEEIHSHLADWLSDEFATKCMNTMAARSPMSMAIALKQLELGALSIEDTLVQDYRIACRVIRGHDFPEGVRALLIDKDQKPLWEPATFNAISAESLSNYFVPLPAGKDLAFA